MGTWKSPKVIIKNVIGPFEGSKMVFNVRHFLQFEVILWVRILGRYKIGINS